jgi:peptide/nickel transport system substrate-binding protein
MGTLLVGAAFPVAQAHRAHGPQAAPQSGGSIAVRTTPPPTCLDPQKTANGGAAYIFGAVVDTLISEAPGGKLEPDLALKWQVSNGGTVLTFFLRHGVRFSNGDPFTAADVKATFDRALDPATKSPATATYLGTLKATRVIDPYTVQLTLKAPYRPIMTNLAYTWEGILDVKAMNKQGDQACQVPIGTGPFKVQSAGPGYSSVTIVRNDYHSWEVPGAHNRGPAYLDKIVFQAIVNDATAASALVAGSLDVSTITGSQLGRVQGNHAYTVYSDPEQAETYLGFNLSHPPFDKLVVRKAIAEAIDRDALVKAAAGGLGQPAYSPIPSSLPFYDANAKSYAPQYNPSDARQILQANHVTGPFTLLTFGYPNQSTAGELIQAELAAVGVTVKVVSPPPTDYLSQAGKGQFDLNLMIAGSNDADFLYSFFHSSQETGNGLNYTFYKSKTLDDLLTEGRETLNQTKAAQYYRQLQRFLDQNVLMDPLWIDEWVTAMRARVQGWHYDSTNILPYWQDLYLAH